MMGSEDGSLRRAWLRCDLFLLRFFLPVQFAAEVGAGCARVTPREKGFGRSWEREVGGGWK